MKEILDRLRATMKEIFPCCDTDKGEYRVGQLCGLNGKDSSFAIIAVRCNTKVDYIKRKLKTGVIYQLLQGYTIEDNLIKVSKRRIAINHIYDDFSNEDIANIPHVQFSAVVGKNGTGKSSLIEFLLRLINNYAAIIKGEVNKDPASERLHYVENADGDVWYAMNGEIIQLTIENASYRIKVFTKDAEEEDDVRYTCKGKPLGYGDKSAHKKGQLVHAACDEPEAKQYLSLIFYTLVSNYSIYAYNTNDYYHECCTNKKEFEIRGSKKDEVFPIEERCWLHGLFHKNDGYNILVNISPFRLEGNMDINVENQLANERLISLLITQEEYRHINEHLDAVALKVKPCEDDYYGYQAIHTRLRYINLSKKTYQNLRNDIVSLWGEVAGKDLTTFSQFPLYDLAVDYLVYKTLKVSMQYKEHNDFYFGTHTSDAYSKDALRDLILKESNDHSHITRKIFQTLAFIIFPVYRIATKAGNIVETIAFENLAGNWHSNAVKGNVDSLTRNKAHLVNSALIPPPFYKYSILLREKSEDNADVEFSSLSSGEKQQVYAISSILYHLNNLNSIADDESSSNRVFYGNVNVILEEIELYFHPEMQRSFVKQLLKSVQSIRLEHLKAINFILITHSPYVLSDIPQDNVLALGMDGIVQSGFKTFGANIHEMLKSSFFLSDGSDGLFARWEFSHIMACLLIHRWAKKDNCDYKDYGTIMKSEAFDFMERYCTIDTADMRKYFEYTRFNEELGKEQLSTLINLIDEPLMHNALTLEYNKTFSV